MAGRARWASDPSHTKAPPTSHRHLAESASHAPSPVHSHAGRPAEREIEAIERIPRLAARDPFVTGLGIRVVDGGAGHAAVALALTDAHLNFNGSCHGGVIFALADTAFGLASNSRGLVAAGIDAHIAYHVAAMPGDVLTATAVEVSRTRKLAVYRVDVARGDATPVASFTGTVYLTSRPNEPHAPAA